MPVPVIGIVEPAIEKGLKTTKNNRIGIIGTEATIQSSVYQKMLRQRGPGMNIFDLVSCLTISLQNFDVAWAEERCAPAKIGWGKASFKRIT